MLESEHRQFLRRELGKILSGFLCICSVFDRTAQLTQSTLGEVGVLICAVVLVTTFGVEKLIFKQSTLDALRSLGLGCPSLRTMLVAIFIGVMLLAFYSAFSVVTGAKLTLRDN